jgi:hypothetical protein
VAKVLLIAPAIRRGGNNKVFGYNSITPGEKRKGAKTLRTCVKTAFK